MQANFKLEELNNDLNILNSDLDSLKGKISLLKDQIKKSQTKIYKFTKNKKIYFKSVELLNFVQQITKIKIKEGFEKIVTHALKYIYNDNYSFELEFRRRGNLNEINFNIKTPKCKETLDLLNSSGGGILDIISIALRIALLELIKPKIQGFLVLDESFKHLSSEYLYKVNLFIKEVSKRMNRQIILITHRPELINEINNIIKI